MKFVGICCDQDNNIHALTEDGKVYVLDDEEKELWFYCEVKKEVEVKEKSKLTATGLSE